MKKNYLLLFIFIFCAIGLKAQTFNYAEALQKSLYFYDAEKCGPGVTGLRLAWRGDCHVSDRVLPLNEDMTNLSASFINANRSVLDPDGDGTLDVSGGYHDAGDHVKFGLPQTYSSSTLEWAFYEFRDAFVQTGELDHIKEILKWASDYYLKCTYLNSSGDVVAFCYQVGEGNIDHNFWGPPEIVDTKAYPRPAHFATSETPASDQCAGAAASLALSYLNDKSDDAVYAGKCLSVSEALYRFAVQNRGLGYSGGFYNSSYDEDELAWAAIWLYIATNNEDYLNDITSIDATGHYTGWLGKIINSAQDQWQNIWVHSWDTKWGGVFAKLAPITNDPFHWWIFRWNLEYWSGVPHQDGNDGNYLAKTPAGFSFLNSWGSARYNAAAQFQGMVYKKYAQSNIFDNWMTSQINYIMGDNPLGRSYIVGYSDNYASHPHHRAAHGSPDNSMFDPPVHKHILWGALVGGPGAEDEHDDATNDFVYNEVAIDYNAGLVGALAGHYYYFGQGQQTVSPFPIPDPPLVEYQVEAKMEQENTERTQLTVRVTNESAFPPKIDIPVSVRYYFNISELFPFNQSIDDVQHVIYYDQNASNGDPVTALGPYAYDAANGIYYIEFKWPDSGFYGKRELQFGLVVKQASDYTSHWDPANDYSREGLTDTYSDNGHIVMFANGVKVAGEEPGGGEIVDVSGVTLSPAGTTMEVGGVLSLTASVLPSNATDKSVSWTSSDETVATVSRTGVVTAVGDGNAIITVTTTDGGYTATSAITVSTSITHVTGVTVIPATISGNTGSTIALTATVLPSDATNKSVSWSSDNSSVATVNSNGVVTIIAIGMATITVTTEDGGYTATSEVSPVIIHVDGVTVTPTTASVDQGESVTLTAIVSPSDASDKSVSWSTSDATIATVNSSGVVTGVAEGTATITVATTDGGYTASAEITVNPVINPPVCDNPEAISLPFSKDGAGEFCYSTDQSISYVNSWNMVLVEINGIDYTNKWSSSMPPAIDGKWYVKYSGQYPWSHFEAASQKGAGETSVPSGLSMYPNPVKNQLYIESNIQLKQISIISSDGKVAKTSHYSGGYYVNIDTGDIPRGIYIVKIETKESIIYKQLVKN